MDAAVGMRSENFAIGTPAKPALDEFDLGVRPAYTNTLGFTQCRAAVTAGEISAFEAHAINLAGLSASLTRSNVI